MNRDIGRLALGLIVLCACRAPVQTAVPTPSALTIPDVVVHRPLSENALDRNWGLKVYDSSQIGIGFVRPQDVDTPPSELPQNDELHLAEGEPLNLYLVLVAAQHSTFLISALIDYQQTPFTLDGQFGLLHEIDQEAEGDLYVPIQIEVSGPGAHDLILIAFKNPYDRPADHDVRFVGSSLFVGRRTVVIVGDDDRPINVVQPNAVGGPPPANVDWGTAFLFANSSRVHPSKPDGQLRLTAQGRPNQTFPYRIWLSNLDMTRPAPVTYGLVLFLNYHQVRFKGQMLYVVHLDQDQEIILDDSLNLPNQTGTHEVQFMYVYDPYQSLLHNQVHVPFVFSSGCLGIETP